MRSADLAGLVIALLASAGGGCALSLDDPPVPDTDPEIPQVASCTMLAAAPEILGATGRVQTLVHPGGVLVVADALERAATSVANAVWTMPPSEALTDACAEGLAPALEAVVSEGVDVAALGADAHAELLALFLVDETPRAFVRTSRAGDELGIGIATWDADGARFVAGPDYLFAAGRPGYGDAALVADGFVYAYGCAESGFLQDDCFVARAPLERNTDPTAWRYYRDGDDFGDDPDDAWPIFRGGRGLAVAHHDGRVVAAYATPLGDTVFVRVGLGPTGPWSPALAVTRCDLPAGGFCGSIALHPALQRGDGTLTLSYAIRSFDPLTVAERLTRLVGVTLER